MEVQSALSRVAVLDIDGTLIPGSLGLSFLRAMELRGIINADACTALFAVIDRQRAGALTYADMVEATTTAYAHALRGAAAAAAVIVAAEVWAEHRGGLFPFVRPLVDRLRAAGLAPVIVSSSPQEIVDHLAAELGIADAAGSRFPAPDGVYDGTCARMPGRPGGKEAALRGLAADRGWTLDLAGSIAVGNAPSDVSVLELVGGPLAFEPVAELERLARARGWTICGRETILAALARALE